MSEIENADRKVYWIGPLLGDGGYEEEGRALVAAIRLAGFNVREINIPPPWTFDRVSQTGLKQDLIVDSDPSSIYIYIIDIGQNLPCPTLAIIYGGRC